MTRHQRVLAAIQGNPVDRAPTFLLAIACEVTSRILGRQAYSGSGSLHYAEVSAWAKGHAAHQEFEQQLDRDILEIHRVLDIDVFRPPWRMNVRPTKQLDEYTFLFGDADGAHSVWKYNPESADFSAIKKVGAPQSPEEHIRQVVAKMECEQEQIFAQVHRDVEAHARLCQRIGDEFFVMAGGGGVSVGMDEMDLMALALEPELMKRKTMAMAREGVEVGKQLLKHRCPRAMTGGGDMANNRGPMYSPQSFREVMLPAVKYLCDELKKLGVHYIFRSDGNLWPVADMFFKEAGVPGYGEVDRDAGMTAAELRKRYPELVIWCNLSSAFLHQRTANQVRQESQRILSEAGSRYVHGCSNCIVKGTPPENVGAMFEVR
jgi:uroporphyrinogen decarboxylase